MNLFKRKIEYSKRNIVAGCTLVAVALLILNGCSSFGGNVSDKQLEKMQKSEHFKEGKFVNTIPQSPENFGLYWDYLKEQFGGDQIRHPPSPIPVQMLNKDSFSNLPPIGLKAIWFGHSSVYIELDGYRLMVDPVFSEYASPFSWIGPKRFHPTPIPLELLPKIDAVMISHDHYDHLDMQTVKHLASNGTQFYLPLGVSTHLIEWGIPSSQIIELDWWEGAKLGTLAITSTPARHYSGRSLLDYKETFWASWSIAGPKHSVFYSGDTGYSDHFKEIGNKLGPFDLSIIKIGAYGPGQPWIDIHMEAEKSVTAHQDLKAKYMLPVHWATFNMGFHDWDEPIKRTLTVAQKMNINLLTPKVGEVVQPGSPQKNAHWWEDVK
ncbi:MAG: MBL fold metallo-hydrolase [Sneathiella sp.]